MRKAILTPEMEVVVLLRHSESVSSRKIAKELGVGAWIISSCLQKHGLSGANNRRLVSPQQLTDLVSLAKEGVTYDEMITATGLRRKTIDGCLKENGISKPLRKALPYADQALKQQVLDLIEEGASISEVANSLALKKSFVRYTLELAGVKSTNLSFIEAAKITPGKELDIVNLRQDGLSIDQVAKIVGVSSSTVHRHIQEHTPASPKLKLDSAKAKQIVELNIAGSQLRAIAELVGVCKETVSHLLNIPGVHQIIGFNPNDGITDAVGQLICAMYDRSFRKGKIAAILGILPDEIGIFLELHRPEPPLKELTEELKSEIRKLIDNGLKYSEIGRSIGIKPHIVRRFCFENDLVVKTPSKEEIAEKKRLRRLRNGISKTVHKQLKRFLSNSGGFSISDYLPYTIQDLKKHLENLFESWMNWDNWGAYNPNTWDTKPVWQIDHIVPVSIFNFTSMEDEDFQKCWALSNLRPYSAKQNQHDGATRIRHAK